MSPNSRDDRDYKVRKLSGSADGRGIPISATASPGTTLHNALGSPAANEWDAVTFEAQLVPATGTAPSWGTLS